MTDGREPATLEQATDVLTGFALDREDIKILLQALPDASGLDKTTLEYEFQLLKIVCTGWAIPYFLADKPEKKSLAESFWQAINRFSAEASRLTGASTGLEVNYFDVLKERADIYVQAIHRYSTETEPDRVIGQTLAEICKAPDQSLVVTSGRRIFKATLAGVKQYLAAVTINETGITH